MPLSSIDVKRLNRINLYRAVLKEDTVSRNDLSASLGLSLPTVAQNVKELLDKGLVKETGTMASTGGRKAAVLAPLAEARLALGVDITRNHISLAAANLKGESRGHRRDKMKFENNPEYYLKAAESVRNFMRENRVPRESLLGVGISLPGTVSEDGMTLLNSHMLNIRGPFDFRIPVLEGTPAKLFNDASAACLAEQYKEGGKQNSFFLLYLSNGVGGALVIDGKIVYGDNRRCGEVGHMCVDLEGPPCYCGGKGHYDSYGSALVLADPAGGRLENFFEALGKGDPDFRGIFDKYLERLAAMVSNLRMCFDLDIVLGGYVGGFLEPHLDNLKSRVAKLDSFQSNADFIRLCQHKMEGAAVGSALYFIDKFIEEV
jgi:predicted NBD/HSP70 family sugar kinase